MNNYIYYGIGLISLIVMVYMYMKRPVVNNHHNFDVKDVKRLLKNTEKSNLYMKLLIGQIAKYIKKNNNDKLRLDILNKSSLFEKDYSKTRIIIDFNNTDGSGDIYKSLYTFDDKIINVIGFKYISSVLKLNTNDDNFSFSINNSYIDLMIDEIPNITLKKKNTNYLVERIPVKLNNNQSVYKHQSNMPDIYFYPITLSTLNFTLKGIEEAGFDIFTVNEDNTYIKSMSFEFEITYLINTTNVGLSSP